MSESSAQPVTLMFTDIQGSTRLLSRLGDASYRNIVARHQELLRQAFAEQCGEEISSRGDGFFVVFQSAMDAVLAAIRCQRLLAAEIWPSQAAVRVRIGIHSGVLARAAELTGDPYVGLDVHRAARLCEAGHGGQILLSATTRDDVTEELPATLSLRALGEHHLRDLPNPEPIFQLVGEDLPSSFPPLRALDVRIFNLPAPRTSFIGREHDLAFIQGLLLRDDVGLVTLTGPAGTGKTRLALAVASAIRDQFRDGICFVALAPLGESDLVVSTIVRRLGLHEAGSASLEETLFGHLRDREMLLILDNFEHLLEAARVVADLLTACPSLKILVTSRAPLRLSGEYEAPVPPLELPDPAHSPPDSALIEFPAIALFMQRAASIRPDFAATPANLRAVAETCQRLDGLPLAIELAAARVGLLSPMVMLTRLKATDAHASLDLLTTGSRDAPARHRTLRDAIGWSYSLLSEAEQVLFRRLSVFVGGISLEAIAALVISGDRLELPPAYVDARPPTIPLEILDLVGRLAENSLLQHRTDQPGDEPRFAMLETIREYGLEQLELRGELSAMRRWHAAYHLALAEEGGRRAGGTHQGVWLGRLDEEHANLRAALSWALAPDSPIKGMGAHLAATLWVFWFRRGHLREGTRWVQQAYNVSDALPPLVRATLLTADGAFARVLGDFEWSERRLEAGANLFREIDDREGVAWALSHLGLVRQWLGQLDEGVEVLEESLALRRQLGDDRGIARSLFHLAISEDFRRQYGRATDLYEETLEVQRRVGDTWGMGRVLGYQSKTVLRQGDIERAAALSEEGLRLSRAAADNWGVALASATVAGVAWARGDLAGAGAALKESLLLFRDVGSRDRIAECLQDLASLACQQGAMHQTVRLSAAAEATQQRIGLALWPAVAARRDQDLPIARAHLGDTVFGTAWAAGLPMSIDQAIDDALTTPSMHAADSRLASGGDGG